MGEVAAHRIAAIAWAWTLEPVVQAALESLMAILPIQGGRHSAAEKVGRGELGACLLEGPHLFDLRHVLGVDEAIDEAWLA